MKHENERDRLICQVSCGELDPKEAEAEAKVRGLGKLATKPNSEQFDPFKTRDWTLPMVIAWVIWRDGVKVREYWDAYRENYHYWGFSEGIGWRIVTQTPASISTLVLDLTYDNLDANEDQQEPTIVVQNAIERIWSFLADGTFQANGIDTNAVQRREISSIEWRDLKVDDALCSEEIIVLPKSTQNTSSSFRDVVIPRKEIITSCPRNTETRKKSRPRKRRDTSDFDAIYEKQLRAIGIGIDTTWPNKDARPSNNKMATKLATYSGVEWGPDAIKRILGGTYTPVIRYYEERVAPDWYRAK
jgi:hypothetical protein